MKKTMLSILTVGVLASGAWAESFKSYFSENGKQLTNVEKSNLDKTIRSFKKSGYTYDKFLYNIKALDNTDKHLAELGTSKHEQYIFRGGCKAIANRLSSTKGDINNIVVDVSFDNTSLRVSNNLATLCYNSGLTVSETAEDKEIFKYLLATLFKIFKETINAQGHQFGNDAVVYVLLELFDASFINKSKGYSGGPAYNRFTTLLTEYIEPSVPETVEYVTKFSKNPKATGEYILANDLEVSQGVDYAMNILYTLSNPKQ